MSKSKKSKPAPVAETPVTDAVEMAYEQEQHDEQLPVSDPEPSEEGGTEPASEEPATEEAAEPAPIRIACIKDPFKKLKVALTELPAGVTVVVTKNPKGRFRFVVATGEFTVGQPVSYVCAKSGRVIGSETVQRVVTVEDGMTDEQKMRGVPWEAVKEEAAAA